MGIDNLKNGLNRVQDLINNAIETSRSYISERPLGATAVAGAAGLVLGGVVGSKIAKRKKRKSKSRSSRKRDSRSRSKKRKTRRKTRSRDHKFLSKQKHEQRYKRKRKRPYKIYKSRRGGVKYTKNGQPYIILSNGKARFIKGKRRK